MTECEWMDIFASNLIEMLQEARMTQRELADAAGLSEGAISMYISRNRMPNVKALINISEALDVTLDDLMYFGDRIY